MFNDPQRVSEVISGGIAVKPTHPHTDMNSLVTFITGKHVPQHAAAGDDFDLDVLQQLPFVCLWPHVNRVLSRLPDCARCLGDRSYHGQ